MHETRTWPAESGGMFKDLAPAALLESPRGRELVDRIDAATDPDYPHRRVHVRQIALVALAAKGAA